MVLFTIYNLTLSVVYLLVSFSTFKGGPYLSNTKYMLKKQLLKKGREGEINLQDLKIR